MFCGSAKLMKEGVEARKREVKVRISRDERKEYVKTGNVFLDKIVNGLSDHSPFSLVVETSGSADKILEDSGFAIGLALKKLLEAGGKKSASYIHSDGSGVCTFSLDLSGEFRGSTIQLIGKPKEFDPNDLFVFFDCLSQGMDSEIKGVVNLGKRRKNEIEFVSAAFAGSLRQMFG